VPSLSCLCPLNRTGGGRGVRKGLPYHIIPYHTMPCHCGILHQHVMSSAP
jgi:hypothetical protein